MTLDPAKAAREIARLRTNIPIVVRALRKLQQAKDGGDGCHLDKNEVKAVLWTLTTLKDGAKSNVGT